MRLVSAALDAEVAGSTSGDVLEVNAWRGGALLAAALDVTAWGLDWDATRQVQGQATFTVADPVGSLAPWGLSDPLAPGGSRLQVTWVSGLSGLRIPLGWWRIRKAEPGESWRLIPSRTPTGSVGAVAHTNLATNPDAETAGAVATVRANRATHATAKAYVTGAASANLGWTNNRWFGSAPAAGTYTLVAGASDGPLSTITSYARKTWTVAGAGGNTGFNTNGWTGFTPGAVYVVSGWIRSSIARTGVGWTVWWYDATGALQRSDQTTGTLAANTWARFAITVTAPAAGSGATYAVFILDTNGSQTIPVGTVVDVAGLLVEDFPAAAVGAVSRTNLHTNPSLHRNMTNWNPINGGATVTITRETTMGATTGGLPHGPTHPWYKMTATATNTVSPLGIYTQGATVATGTSAVVAGKSYMFSAYGVCSYAAGPGFRVDWVWYNAASAVISSASATSVATTPNAWQRLVSTPQVAPAGAAFVALRVLLSAAAGTFPVGGFIGVTAAQIEQVTSLPQYWDGYSVGSATLENAWTGALGNSPSVGRAVPSPIALPYFDGSTPAAGDFTYAWAGAVDASASTQRAPAIVGVSSFNGTLAARWSSVTERAGGARSWACMPLASNQIGFIWTVTPLTAGQWITATLRVKAPAGYTLALSARTSSGGGQDGVNFTGTGDWQTVTCTSLCPSDGYLVGVQLVNRYATGQLGVPFYADRLVLVVEGATYTGPYFDGDTPDTADTWVYSWTGTPHASTSTQAAKVVTYASTVRRVPGGGVVTVAADEETATAVLNRLDAEVPVPGKVLAEVTRLLRDVAPVKVLPGVTDGDVPAALVYSDARMDAVEDLLAVIRAGHRMAGDGTLEVVPEAGVGPVWTLAGGDAGVLVELSRALSDDQIYNGVTSSNEDAGGQPLIGRAFLTYGPLAWGGPFGKVPLFHKAVGTTPQAVLADAQTTLANRQSSGEVDLAVTCLAHPGLQPQDRVTILAPTVAGDAPITGRVVGMHLSSAGSQGGATPAKAMGLTVRVSTNDLEAIASRVRRG